MILPETMSAAVSADAETELVKRARDGDRAAQEELAQRYRRSIYFFALQLLGNADDALDVTQDAMLRFFTTLHRFDCRRPVRPWLYQIVRNRAYDLFRRRKVRRHDSIDATDDEGRFRVELIDTSVDPEHDVARSQLRARVWQALENLTPNQREILVLRDYQDLSYAEIAETLGIPIGTVMSRLHGARKRLRTEVHDDLRALAT